MRLFAVFAFALAALVASPRADACNDVSGAPIDRARIVEYGAVEVTPPFVRGILRWATRFAALVPLGKAVTVEASAPIRVCDADADMRCTGDESTLAWPAGEGLRPSAGAYQDALKAVGAHFGASRAAIARASTLEPPSVRTVQVLAALDRATASRVAVDLDAVRYDERASGAFGTRRCDAPSTGRVLEERDATGRRLFRVVTGVFVTSESADAARDTLRRAGYRDAFVRPF